MNLSVDFNDPSINDLEFAKRLVESGNKALEGLYPDDFDIDQEQMRKFDNLVEFFKKAAKDLGGKIESVSLNPTNPPSGVTANFVVFDLFGDDVQKFCDVIRECSAISMDITDKDEISISCTIPGVFKFRS